MATAAVLCWVLNLCLWVYFVRLVGRRSPLTAMALVPGSLPAYAHSWLLTAAIFRDIFGHDALRGIDIDPVMDLSQPHVLRFILAHALVFLFMVTLASLLVTVPFKGPTQFTLPTNGLALAAVVVQGVGLLASVLGIVSFYLQFMQ